MSSIIVLIPTGIAFAISFIVGRLCAHYELHHLALSITYFMCLFIAVEVISFILLRLYLSLTRHRQYRLNNWVLFILAGINIGLVAGFLYGYGEYWLDFWIQKADETAKTYLKNKFK